jgi:hypothetical protein
MAEVQTEDLVLLVIIVIAGIMIKMRDTSFFAGAPNICDTSQ